MRKPFDMDALVMSLDDVLAAARARQERCVTDFRDRLARGEPRAKAADEAHRAAFNGAPMIPWMQGR